jgi:hypothetical protein
MVLSSTILAVTLLLTQNDTLRLLRQMDLEAPPHEYYSREPLDRFSLLKKDIDSGDLQLDRSTEKAFLLSLLKALEIPASSQMLVFSTTSLQLSLITPSNPRALYFNEDTYLGFIPGGKIEIVSIDPELGGIFYILEIPKTSSAALNIERSRRCMNCHSGSETGYVPGLNIKSVIPGTRGGSLESFRVDLTGHDIPLNERFGGWYLTGENGWTNHWANAIGRMFEGNLTKQMVLPGERFSYDKYLVSSSDILPQLVHEHQAGFINRAMQAAYLARIYLHQNSPPTQEQQGELERHARELTRYILFADEAGLPEGGFDGDNEFKEAFRRDRKKSKGEASLKDFDLQRRLFKHRCSYMIYSQVFQRLPASVKGPVLRELKLALAGNSDSGSHLSAEEKQMIISILRETLPGFDPL